MENYKPLVSVIMPAFNCKKYVSQAIKSTLNQTYSNWELLISDDGSTDGTQMEIEKFVDSRILFIGRTENLGAFSAKNLLLKKAKGEFITFLDADDFMSPNRIELQLKILIRNKSFGMLGCQVGYVDSKGRLIKTSTKPTQYKDVLENIYENNVIGGSIMFIRKSVLENVGGGFRRYFGRLSYQDYDLSILIAEKFPCYNLPEVLYFYRQHRESISKSINPDRILAKEIVIHLAKQRKARGGDDLIEGNPRFVDQYFDQLRKPYKEDISLIYREFAAKYMYHRLFIGAIKTSWKAVITEPFKVVNWRTLQYCIRISILKSFTHAN